MTRLSLLIDADDTLWENNIYFERAFADFCDFLDHSALTPPQVREVLNEIELVNSKIHGYGSKNFGRNLQQAYQHLAEREIEDEGLRHVLSLAERILEQPIEVIDGVEETLGYLSERHDLTLFTKGNPEEQLMKVDRSELGRYFTHTAVVKEKDAPAYSRLVAERGLAHDLTWMIGNSPKSDINPALEAGLNAVLVPHPHTWVLEHQDLRDADGAKFLRVERFADLRRHF
ncbi:MAG: HAD hydrolase-like protein [Acidobacteriota bacterium]|nr:HAD hydrolase-like protein [Acidobacteriota bacterium]